MSEWLKAYERLPEERKVDVQRWIHLNKFIANTLRIDEKAWFEQYLGDAMANPLDFSFMAPTIPGFSGVEVPGQGESFSKAVQPGMGPKVPLRAANNLGKLSPALQDVLATMLENAEPRQTKLLLSDVAQMQKIFPGEKALAKLKRPDFRNVVVVRDAATDDIVLRAEGVGEVLRVNLLEFAAVLGRKLH